MTIMEIRKELAVGTIQILQDELGTYFNVLAKLSDERLAEELAGQDNPEGITVGDLKNSIVAYNDLLKTLTEWGGC